MTDAMANGTRGRTDASPAAVGRSSLPSSEIANDVVVPGPWFGVRPRRAIVPVAGRGSRLWPASLAVPKALFPIIDANGVARTVLDLILDELWESGVTEVCLVAPPNADAAYRDYLDRSQAAGFWSGRPSVSFATQPTPEGYGHAVWCAASWAAGEPVVVMLGDTVYTTSNSNRCVRQVLDGFARLGLSTSGVLVTPENEIGGYGTIGATAISGSPGDFLAHIVVEKPSVEVARASLAATGLAPGTYLTWFGIHAVTRGIFDVLEEDIRLNRRDRGEFQFTGAQGRLVAREGYAVTVIDGDRHDTGNPSAWQASMAALRRTHSPLART